MLTDVANTHTHTHTHTPHPHTTHTHTHPHTHTHHTHTHTPPTHTYSSGRLRKSNRYNIYSVLCNNSLIKVKSLIDGSYFVIHDFCFYLIWS